jgi:hypothetical protein
MTPSGGGDFLFPCRACVLPPVSLRGIDAVAAVPVVLAGPACVLIETPTGKPSAALLEPVVACPSRFPTLDPTGKPSAPSRVLVLTCPPGVPTWVPLGGPTPAPPANTWGLVHVGSGCSLACGGRSKLTTGPRLAAQAAGVCARASTPHAVPAPEPVSAACANRDWCRHGNARPSGSATHLSQASAQIAPPRLSKRTSAGMDVMLYLAINDNVRVSIPTSSSASCHIDNHGMFSR